MQRAFSFLQQIVFFQQFVPFLVADGILVGFVVNREQINLLRHNFHTGDNPGPAAFAGSFGPNRLEVIIANLKLVYTR